MALGWSGMYELCLALWLGQPWIECTVMSSRSDRSWMVWEVCCESGIVVGTAVDCIHGYEQSIRWIADGMGGVLCVCGVVVGIAVECIHGYER